MRTALLASATAIVLAAAPLAHAQQQQPGQPQQGQQAQTRQEPQTETQPMQLSAVPETMPAEEVEGREILGRNGNVLGNVGRVQVGPDGKVENVVVERGGVLGLGQERVSIAWDRIRMSPDGDLVADLSESELAELPPAE